MEITASMDTYFLLPWNSIGCISMRQAAVDLKEYIGKRPWVMIPFFLISQIIFLLTAVLSISYNLLPTPFLTGSLIVCLVLIPFVALAYISDRRYCIKHSDWKPALYIFIVCVYPQQITR
jgi:hypothetical protein